MKKNISKLVLILAIIILSLITNSIFAQAKKSTPAVNYKSIKIGNQIWMTENLNVSTFRNGDPIPEFKKDVNNKSNEDLPYWCYYDFSISNGNSYGKLYNWGAVNDKRGLAPKGWHIPSYEEWKELADFLGYDTYSSSAGTALNKLKSTSGWEGYYNGNGTNETGFNAMPGGHDDPTSSNPDVAFGLTKEMGSWWCSKKVNNDSYEARIDGKYSSTIPFLSKYHSDANSVRCIKDGNTLPIKSKKTTSSSTDMSGFHLTGHKNTGMDAYTDAERAEIKKKQQDKESHQVELNKKAQQKFDEERARKTNVPKVKARVRGENEPANTIAK